MECQSTLRKVEKEKKEKSLSHVQLFATPWTVAYQGPLSVGFFRQEYWSELPFSPPGDLSNPGPGPCLLYREVDSLLCEPPGKPNKYFS